MKCELARRGLTVSGNKDELIIRLADALNSEGTNLEEFERKCITSYEMNEEGAKPKSSDISVSYGKNRDGHDKSVFEDEKSENVDPEDSISNVSHRSCCHSSVSGTSSARNARALERARLAGLKAKASKLREIQLLGQQKLKLQQEKELLSVQAEIAEAMARNEELAKFESNQSFDNVNNNVEKSLLKPRENLQECDKNLSGVGLEQLMGIKNKTEETEANNVIETLISYNLKSLMPRTEIPKFGGDFIEYRTFIGAFDTRILKL